MRQPTFANLDMMNGAAHPMFWKSGSYCRGMHMAEPISRRYASFSEALIVPVVRWQNF